jgi:hypothetical protein
MIDGVRFRDRTWVVDDRFITLREVDNVIGWVCLPPKFKNPRFNFFTFPLLYGYGITATIYSKIMGSQNKVNKKHILEVLHD